MVIARLWPNRLVLYTVNYYALLWWPCAPFSTELDWSSTPFYSVTATWLGFAQLNLFVLFWTTLRSVSPPAVDSSETRDLARLRSDGWVFCPRGSSWTEVSVRVALLLTSFVVAHMLLMLALLHLSANKKTWLCFWRIHGCNFVGS